MYSKPVSALIISLLLAISLFVSVVPLVNAQVFYGDDQNFEITYDMYNWTPDMKRLSITTSETDLIFNVTISNNGSKPLAIGYSGWNEYLHDTNNLGSLIIIIEITSPTGTYLSRSSQTIAFSSSNQLYLPLNTSLSVFVAFATTQNSLPIGSYSAKVSFYVNQQLNYGFNGVLIGNTPVGRFPFNFDVQTVKTLEDTIALNPAPQVIRGTYFTYESIIIAVLISVIIAVILSVVITLIITKSVFKKKFENQKIKKIELFGILTTILSLIISMLQLLRT
jgi:uncharacterized protein YbcV (DUF1398 family)